MKRNVHKKLTSVGIRSTAFRYSDPGTMQSWDTQVTLTTTKVQLLNPKTKGPDVWLAMMLWIPYRLLHIVNLTFLTWNFRCIETCLQCHVKSMFTKHQKAERKMMFIICNALKLFFLKNNDKGLNHMPNWIQTV